MNAIGKSPQVSTLNYLLKWPNPSKHSRNMVMSGVGAVMVAHAGRHLTRRSLCTSSWRLSPPRPQAPIANVLYLSNPFVRFNNWLQLLSLKMSWDPQFNSNVFIEATKQAVITVSSLVARGDFNTLLNDNLVSSKALEDVRSEASHFDNESRSLLMISADEIHIANVLRVNLQAIVDVRHADIDILFVSAKYRIGSDSNDTPSDVLMIFVTTRFHREYTDGILPNWTITKLSYKFAGLQ